MAINMAKLAERLAQLNSSGSGESSGRSYIDLVDGRNVVRVLPPRPGTEDFAVEVWVHYKVGANETNKKGSTVVCPTTLGGDSAPCPVCELSKELRKLSKNKEDSYAKQAREVGRKKRVYYNAIDRSLDLNKFTFKEGKWFDEEGKENSPVQILATGSTVYKDILGIICDPEYGDITDPEQGLDLIITKSGTGMQTKYDTKTVRKESPVGFDQWKDCLHDLSVLAKAKPYDEIAKMLDGGAEDSSADSASTTDGDSQAPAQDSAPTGGDALDADIQAALRRRRGQQ